MHLFVGKRFGVVQCRHHGRVAQLFHHNLGGILVQRLVDGDHLTQFHQLFDDFRGLDRHLVRQLSHGNGFWYVHFNDAHFLRLRGRVVFAITIAAALTARTGAPVGRAARSCTGVTAGFEFFFLRRVAGPAAR